jgi:hypothetical protein
LPLKSGDSDRKILKEIYEYMSKEFKRKANHALAVQEFVKNMDSTQVDVNVLRDLYPNPRPLEPTSICGYCVGGTLMAYVDGITAAMADAGEKPRWRAHYFPRVPELTEILQKANSRLSEPVAKKFADFITRLNDRKRFSFAWSYLKQALEWKEGDKDF